LGPDSDALILTLSFRPHDRTKLTLSGSIERHGEGRVGQPWSRESDPDDWFLSGVVEKGARVSLGVEHDLWGPVVLAGSLEYAARSNSNNVMGESRKDWGSPDRDRGKTVEPCACIPEAARSFGKSLPLEACSKPAPYLAVVL